jgi:hypothetical protein
VHDTGNDADQKKVIEKRSGATQGFKRDFKRGGDQSEDSDVSDQVEQILMNERAANEAPQLAVLDDKLRAESQQVSAGRVKESQLADVDGSQEKGQETSPKGDRVEKKAGFVHPVMPPRCIQPETTAHSDAVFLHISPW